MSGGGFTLLELLIAVVIVGILAALAIPNFTKSIEKGKVRDAEVVLSSLHSAERVYYLDQNSYGTDANLFANGYATNPDAGNSNPDWDYAAAPAGTTFSVTATRTGGGYNGKTIQVTQTFHGRIYGGNHPLRDQ